MFCIAVCEDDEAQLSEISELLREYGEGRAEIEIITRVFRDGDSLLKESESLVFDLYLLDIIMPGGIDGIAAAKVLRARDADTPVIFLTSSADYALEAFNVSAFQYLLKPIDRKCLFGALDRIIRSYERSIENSFIMVQAAGSTHRIPFAEIVFVELIGRSLTFRLSDGASLTSKTIRGSFSAAVAPLLADGRFLNAHKSYALNMEWVRELRPRSFVMRGGFEIPIPRQSLAEAKGRYFEYLSARGIGMVTHAK